MLGNFPEVKEFPGSQEKVGVGGVETFDRSVIVGNSGLDCDSVGHWRRGSYQLGVGSKPWRGGLLCNHRVLTKVLKGLKMS